MKNQNVPFYFERLTNQGGGFFKYTEVRSQDSISKSSLQEGASRYIGFDVIVVTRNRFLSERVTILQNADSYKREQESMARRRAQKKSNNA